MVIDLILDRKYGAKYKAREFYTDMMRYHDIFPEITEPILSALDGGTEKDVKRELSNYIQEQGYSVKICDYINSVGWLL